MNPEITKMYINLRTERSGGVPYSSGASEIGLHANAVIGYFAKKIEKPKPKYDPNKNKGKGDQQKIIADKGKPSPIPHHWNDVSSSK